MIKDIKEFNNVIDQLKKYDLAYEQGKPLISDTEFDNLYFEAKEYNKQNNLNNKYFNQTLPDSLITNNKIHHPYNILSLAKSKTDDEIMNFINKWSTNKNDLYYTDSFLLERKEDGLTVVLYFNDPHMNKKFMAITRGGGHEGQDITNKALNFTNINLPKIINKIGNQHLVVRGEAMIDDADFDKINKNGQFMNSRNAASGTLNTKNDNLVKQRHMKFYSYELINKEDFPEYSELDTLNYLNNIGFDNTSDFTQWKNSPESIKHMLKYINDYNKTLRDKVGHAIDGLVIKPNYVKNLNQIGFTEHHPKYALAFKFEAEQATAILDKIKWEKSSNGKLTPVGYLDKPVYLAGAKINKASLASINNIEQRDLKLKDHVIIQRSNDVIPKITGSIKSLRNGQEIDIHTLIPSGAYRKGAHLYLPVNNNDKNRWLLLWTKFVSKECLNIQGLSKKNLKSMIDNNIIIFNDFSSLWNINKNKFLAIKGLGEKKYNSIQEQLNNLKPSLNKVLLALPIENLGIKLSDYLAKNINKLNSQDIQNNNKMLSLKNNLINKLKQEKGFGQQSINIVNQLFKQDNLNILFNLSQYIKLIYLDSKLKINGKLNGLSFCITGKFDLTRNEIIKLIENNGGQFDKSLKKTTNYLLINDINSTSNKAKKAKQYNTKLINLDMLKKMI